MNLNGKFAEKGAQAIGEFASAIGEMPDVLAEQGASIRALLLIARVGQAMPGVGEDQIMEPIRMAQGEIASILRSLLYLRHAIDVLGPIMLGCARDFGLDDLEIEAIGNEVVSNLIEAIGEAGEQIEDGLDGHPDL